MPPSNDPSTNPEVKALIALTGTIVAEAESFKVTTPVQYADAGDTLKRIKGHQKKLEEAELSMTRPITAGLNAIRDFFRSPRAQAARAEQLVKRAMIAFSDEQDQLRREEQARLDEAARKEREKLEQRAATAAESGKVEKAVQLEQRAAAVVAPLAQREAPKVSGVSTREVWKYEVIDEAALPREYMSRDDSKIRCVVQALKGDTRISGVRVWSEKALAAGAA